MATRGSEYKVGSHVQYETDGGGSQPLQIQIYRPVENSTILRKKSVITMYIKKTSEDEKFTL